MTSTSWSATAADHPHPHGLPVVTTSHAAKRRRSDRWGSTHGAPCHSALAGLAKIASLPSAL
ncbi:MAG: hypothetical protein ACRDTK_11605, partial [Mycobacterium sp.]